MTNLLSQLLVLPRFMDDEACDRILSLVAKNDPVELGIAGQRLEPLSPRFALSDFADPERALARLGTSAAARSVIAQFADAETLASLGRATDLSDLKEELGRAVVAAFDRAVAADDLLARLPGVLPLPQRSAAAEHLGELLEEGVLRPGAGAEPVSAAANEADRLALAWLHVSILEEIFDGGIVKHNRVTLPPFARAVRSGELARGPTGVALGRAVGERLAGSRRPTDVRYALYLVFHDPDTRRRFLHLDGHDPWCSEARELSSSCPERTRTGTNEADVECWVVQALLHRHHPDVVDLPSSATYAGGIRSTRSIADGAAKDAVQPVLGRLAREHVEPHYGVHCVDAPAEVDVLKYVTGGYYVVHSDSCALKDVEGARTWVKILPRDVSVVLYLSPTGAFAGGALSFPDLGVAVRPQRGMAVVFPSDHRFVHCVEPVTRGERVAVVAWMRCEEGVPVGAPFESRW